MSVIFLLNNRKNKQRDSILLKVMGALKRAVLMTESVYGVTVDAESVHHPHARNLLVEGATASRLNP